jgi:hypothetical protein
MKAIDLYYFTGRCLTIPDNKANFIYIKNCILNDAVDWEKFAELCSHHLITPAIYLKFRDSGLMDDLPSELAEYLKEIYELNLKRNIRIIEEIRCITQILNKSAIEPVYIKGSGNLIDGLYTDAGERILGDIDFLVKEAEYLNAAHILEYEGYKKPTPFDFDVEDLKHYPRLAHSERCASVEIHRKAVIKKHDTWFNQELIRSEIKRVEDYPGCFVLSDNHKFIINFIHGQFSDRGNSTGVLSLRNINDVLYIYGRIYPEKLLKNIKKKKEAEAYIRLIERITSSKLIKGKIAPYAKKYINRHKRNYSSNTFYWLSSKLPLLKARISGIIKQIFRSLYSSKSRNYLLQRMKNREWRKGFLPSWKEMLR